MTVLILGVDRFRSEARAITNFIRNTVATLEVSKGDKSFDETKEGGDFGGEETCSLTNGAMHFAGGEIPA